MFAKNTVFILGAGASWHYGYPTGDQLVERVIRQAERCATFLKSVLDDSGERLSIQKGQFWKRYIPDSLPYKYDPKTGWNAAFRECSELARRLRLVHPPLIDSFLAWNSDLAEIGKTMIAFVLRECETKFMENARHNVQRHADERAAAKDNWYRFLLYRLVSGYSDPKKLFENKVTFITFNYDVSLEIFLYEGLSAYEPLRTLVDEFFERFPVSHVYGRIRHDITSHVYTPLVDPPGNHASHDNFLPWMRALGEAAECAKDLCVIDPNTKNDNSAIIDGAKKAVRDAANIYILGYGFDVANSERIGLNEIADLANRQRSRRNIFLTNFQNVNRVAKRASELFFRSPDMLLRSSAHADGQLYCEMSHRDVYGAFELDFDSPDER